MGNYLPEAFKYIYEVAAIVFFAWYIWEHHLRNKDQQPQPRPPAIEDPPVAPTGPEWTQNLSPDSGRVLGRDPFRRPSILSPQPISHSETKRETMSDGDSDRDHSDSSDTDSHSNKKKGMSRSQVELVTWVKTISDEGTQSSEQDFRGISDRPTRYSIIAPIFPNYEGRPPLGFSPELPFYTPMTEDEILERANFLKTEHHRHYRTIEDPHPDIERLINGVDQVVRFYEHREDESWERTVLQMLIDDASPQDAVEMLYVISLFLVKYVVYDSSVDPVSGQTINLAMRYRKTMCLGFARLFHRLVDCLGTERGFRSKVVTGKSSSFGHLPSNNNHAWSCVRLFENSNDRNSFYDRLYLFDLSHGQNHSKGVLCEEDPFNEVFFFRSQKAMILTHFPKKTEDQLLFDSPVSRVDYESQVYRTHECDKIGIETISHPSKRILMTPNQTITLLFASETRMELGAYLLIQRHGGRDGILTDADIQVDRALQRDSSGQHYRYAISVVRVPSNSNLRLYDLHIYRRVNDRANGVTRVSLMTYEVRVEPFGGSGGMLSVHDVEGEMIHRWEEEESDEEEEGEAAWLRDNYLYDD